MFDVINKMKELTSGAVSKIGSFDPLKSTDMVNRLAMILEGTKEGDKTPSPRYNPEHIKEMAATIFGEATANKDEMKAMIDTVLNRRNQLGLDINKVLTQKDRHGMPMYQAHGGKEYQKYMSNDLKRPGEKEKKQILDELINQLQYNKWEPSEYTNFDQAPRKDAVKIGEHYFRKEFQGNR